MDTYIFIDENGKEETLSLETCLNIVSADCLIILKKLEKHSKNLNKSGFPDGYKLLISNQNMESIKFSHFIISINYDPDKGIYYTVKYELEPYKRHSYHTKSFYSFVIDDIIEYVINYTKKRVELNLEAYAELED